MRGRTISSRSPRDSGTSVWIPGSRLSLDDDLLAAQADLLPDLVRCLPTGDAHLFDQPQTLLGYENFLHHGVDGGVTLVPDHSRCLDPAADWHALHLDRFGLDRDVEDLLVLVDSLVETHRVGGDVLLVDHGRFFDNRNDFLGNKSPGPFGICHEVPLCHSHSLQRSRCM